MSEDSDNNADIDNEEYPEYGMFFKDSFDYAAFFERIGSGQASAKDHEEFTVRTMQMFCLQVWNDEEPDKWILNYFAGQFLNILNGADWCDELPLPWIPQNQIWTRAEKQGLDIYCYIENTKRSNPNLKMNILLLEAAEKFKTSYETARDQYYKWRKIVQKQKDSILNLSHKT